MLCLYLNESSIHVQGVDKGLISAPCTPMLNLSDRQDIARECKVQHALNGIDSVLSTISACIYVIRDFLIDQMRCT